MLANKQSTNVG